MARIVSQATQGTREAQPLRDSERTRGLVPIMKDYLLWGLIPDCGKHDIGAAPIIRLGGGAPVPGFGKPFSPWKAEAFGFPYLGLAIQALQGVSLTPKRQKAAKVGEA